MRQKLLKFPDDKEIKQLAVRLNSNILKHLKEMANGLNRSQAEIVGNLIERAYDEYLATVTQKKREKNK